MKLTCAWKDGKSLDVLDGAENVLLSIPLPSDPCRFLAHYDFCTEYIHDSQKLLII